jgi:hypothetical protein
MSGLTGTVNWNVAPDPAFEVAHRRPPRASLIERLIDSPMPIPSVLVVKNASKRALRVLWVQPDAGIGHTDDDLLRIVPLRFDLPKRFFGVVSRGLRKLTIRARSAKLPSHSRDSQPERII